MATIPKLALIPSGYKAGKVYSVLPTSGVGDFIFARGSSATRINSSGLIETVASGVPRLNYPLIDGVVNGCPSHLLEPSRTNLITQSESFDNAYWTKTNSSVVSGFVSPNGSTNAFKLVEDTSTGIHILQPTTPITTVIGTSYSLSAFYKIGERPYSIIGLHYNSSNGCIAEYEFSTDTFVYLGAAGANYSISNLKSIVLANGFVKLSCTITTGHTVAFPSFGVHKNLLTTGIIGNNTYQGNGTSGVYIYGAQVEEGSYPTSYIPNYGTAAGVTRSAETANGSGDASTFNDSEGVLMVEISALANDGTYRYLSLSDGSNSNNVRIFFTSTLNQISFEVNSGASSKFTYTNSDTNVLLNNKVAIKYKQNDFNVFINGIKLNSSTGLNGGNTPIGLDRLNFDRGTGDTHFYNSTKQLQYFDSALNDSDLETLTSWTSFTEMANGQTYSIK